jgi:hypothetical protein
MPNTDDVTGWVVEPGDDGFHDDFEGADHPWWTETFWTSFNVPERKMGGWFYNQVLKNQGEHGTCNGGAWVWDASDAPYLYQRNQHGFAMPPGPRDLRDIALPNGNTIEVLEPLMKYRMTYSDPGKFESDLVFAGVMEPNPHPAGCAPFWKGRHWDQAMQVTGEIVLNGERIAIDCYSVRDRSWSPRRPRDSAKANDSSGGKRPQRPTDALAAPGAHSDVSKPLRKPFNIGYIFGTASPRDAFLVYTMVIQGEEDRGDFTNTGYLVRDGVWAHLVSGQRRCLVDPDHGWIWRIEYDGVDALGREVHIEGEQVSNHGTATGLFYWKWDGAEGWGENQGGIAPSYPRVKRA